MTVPELLKSLGLDLKSTWNDVAPVVSLKLQSAHRHNDHESCVYWSQAKKHLFRRLPKVCSCGNICRNLRAVKCRNCTKHTSKNKRVRYWGHMEFVDQLIKELRNGSFLCRKLIQFEEMQRNPQMTHEQARDGICKALQHFVEIGRLDRIKPGIFRKIW